MDASRTAEVIPVTALAAAEALFQEGKTVSFNNISATFSMGPVVEPGDTVFLSPVPWSVIKTNDIIAYRAGPVGWIIHRLRKKNKDVFITRGDANFEPDEPAPVSAYRAKLIRVIKKDGRPGQLALSFGFRLKRWLKRRLSLLL